MSKHSAKSAKVTRPAPAAAPTHMAGAGAHERPNPHGGVTPEEAVRVRAYQLWERGGRPEGDGLEFWLEAESELKGTGG